MAEAGGWAPLEALVILVGAPPRGGKREDECALPLTLAPAPLPLPLPLPPAPWEAPTNGAPSVFCGVLCSICTAAAACSRGAASGREAKGGCAATEVIVGALC